MTRTSSMVYKPSQEATELYCVARNTSEIWNDAGKVVVDYLRKRWDAGDYDKERAIDLIYNRLVASANRYYRKYYGYEFTVTDRFTASCDIERYIRENIMLKAF